MLQIQDGSVIMIKNDDPDDLDLLPFGALEVTGFEDGCYLVRRPSAANLSQCLINGPEGLKKGQITAISRQFPATVVVDTDDDGTDAFAAGESLGTEAESYKLVAGEGFVSLGLTELTIEGDTLEVCHVRPFKAATGPVTLTIPWLQGIGVAYGSAGITYDRLGLKCYGNLDGSGSGIRTFDPELNLAGYSTLVVGHTDPVSTIRNWIKAECNSRNDYSNLFNAASTLEAGLFFSKGEFDVFGDEENTAYVPLLYNKGRYDEKHIFADSTFVTQTGYTYNYGWENTESETRFAAGPILGNKGDGLYSYGCAYVIVTYVNIQYSNEIDFFAFLPGDVLTKTMEITLF